MTATYATMCAPRKRRAEGTEIMPAAIGLVLVRSVVIQPSSSLVSIIYVRTDWTVEIVITDVVPNTSSIVTNCACHKIHSRLDGYLAAGAG